MKKTGLNPLYSLKINDYLLSVALVIVSVVSLFFIRGKADTTEKQLVIHRNRQTVHTENLASGKIIQVDHVSIEIKNGAVHIIDTDCPKKICQQTGWIRHSAETIVCVPNQLLLEIQSSSSNTQMNAVSY